MIERNARCALSRCSTACGGLVHAIVQTPVRGCAGRDCLSRLCGRDDVAQMTAKTMSRLLQVRFKVESVALLRLSLTFHPS